MSTATGIAIMARMRMIAPAIRPFYAGGIARPSEQAPARRDTVTMSTHAAA